MTSYHHVDVFARNAYSGNGVVVFVDPPALSDGQMARIAHELRQFEAIFVDRPPGADTVHARVFDLFEELDFAGHPVLGAAAVLHDLADAGPAQARRWTVEMKERRALVTTRRETGGYLSAVMDGGRPQWIHPSAELDPTAVATAVGLVRADLDDTLPLAIVSTGLRYLLVPVRPDALGRVRIAPQGFGNFLEGLGAQFAYLLDASIPEGRHWNNDGIVEDVATGSAAGCVAAYLMQHGRLRSGQRTLLQQGRFVGRPSQITIAAYGTEGDVERVTVGGDIAIVGTGTLHALPPVDRP